MSLEDTAASPVAENPEAPNPALAVEAASPEDANPAQSSSVDTTDAKSAAPEDLDSVVRRALAKDPEPAEEPSTSEDGEKVADPEAKAEGEEDPDADVPFHKHPRWKEMIAERDGYKADADSFRSMQGFMHETNLTSTEVAEGFDVMALIKRATMGDTKAAEEARGWFAERLNVFDEMLGMTLPDDLRQKVDDGFMDEDSAKELAAQRAKARNLENAREIERRQADEASEQDQAHQSQVRIAQAVKGWEDGIKASDPDYAIHKAGFVETEVRARVASLNGQPLTPEMALEISQGAYDTVNQRLKALAPKPKPMSPTPAGLSARASAEPKTLREAVASALNR